MARKKNCAAYSVVRLDPKSQGYVTVACAKTLKGARSAALRRETKTGKVFDVYDNRTNYFRGLAGLGSKKRKPMSMHERYSPRQVAASRRMAARLKKFYAKKRKGR